MKNEYEEILEFHRSMAAAKRNGKWGFIDRRGNVVIPFEYDELYKYHADYVWFFCDLINIRKEGKWGYIDPKGNIKIPFIYDYAHCFNDLGKIGYACVETERREIVIDTHGEVVFHNRIGFDIISIQAPIKGHIFFQVAIGDRWGVVNKNEEIIVPIRYSLEKIEEITMNNAHKFMDRFPIGEAELREHLIDTEIKIMDIIAVDAEWMSDPERMEAVSELVWDRKSILGDMFQATAEEISHFERINAHLDELTKKTYRRTASLYRYLLAAEPDNDFDDCWGIACEMIALPETLQLENDDFYGSDFERMHEVLSYLQGRHGFWPEIIHWSKPFAPSDTSDMSDKELGVVDSMDNGITWAEGCLHHPALQDIYICYAVHDICTHKPYSIPDLLRMNCFRCEVRHTRSNFSKQDGSRILWGKSPK